MPHPVFRSGATALITGGASGVGLAIAKYCAGHGMSIALVDINEEKLAAAKSVLSASSPLVETYKVDVSKLEAWTALRKSVEARFGEGGVDLLVLNAGTTVKHDIVDAAAFHTIFDTNFFGYVHGVATFLPALKSKKGDTAVVLTGSKQGITNPPGNPAYNASKAAVRSLAEQLSFDARGSGTSVYLLVPGWTFTGMTGGGGVAEKPAGAWSPEQVADYLGKKMEDGSFYVICPDNDVTEDLDRRRMLWSTGDIVQDRPPLSRWREDWKEKAQQGIDNMKI